MADRTGPKAGRFAARGRRQEQRKHGQRQGLVRRQRGCLAPRHQPGGRHSRRIGAGGTGTGLVQDEGTSWQFRADCRDEQVAECWRVEPDGKVSEVNRAAIAVCEGCPARQACAWTPCWLSRPRGRAGASREARCPGAGSASPEHVGAGPTETAVQPQLVVTVGARGGWRLPSTCGLSDGCGRIWEVKTNDGSMRTCHAPGAVPRVAAGRQCISATLVELRAQFTCLLSMDPRPATALSCTVSSSRSRDRRDEGEGSPRWQRSRGTLQRMAPRSDGQSSSHRDAPQSKRRVAETKCSA